MLRDQRLRQLEIKIGDVHFPPASPPLPPAHPRYRGHLLAVQQEVFDVIIIGGGPAGLNAALVLARCRRTLLLCDAGEPRNARSSALHGFLSRDCIPPLELLRLGREELRPYGVEPRSATVTNLAHAGDFFEATLDDQQTVRARMALIATGVRDHVP